MKCFRSIPALFDIRRTAFRAIACTLGYVNAGNVLRAQAPNGPVAFATGSSGVPVPAAGPPIRRIETASAVSTEPLAGITSVRHLSNGNLLLNDGQRRRLLLLDSTLKVVKVVLDSLTEVENAYGTRAGALLAGRGDTTLFVDAATYAMLVINADGRIVRTRSVPRAQDASYVTQVGNGVANFDTRGRLVYRVPATTSSPMMQMRGDIPVFPQQPDSALIVGIDPETRKLDTLGAIRTPRQIIQATRTQNGYETRSMQSPLPLVDDWAVLSDGTIAFVRGRDYRIDYLNADGSSTSSGKLAFPWVRMNDEDKQRFIDSVRTIRTREAQQNFLMEMIAWSNILNKPYPASFKPEPGIEPYPGVPRDWILPTGMRFPANYAYACPPTIPGAPPAPATPAVASTPGTPGTTPAPRCVPNNYSGYYGSGYTPPPPTYRKPLLIPVAEMPDYKPPIATGSVRADADGNLWIRVQQMKPVPGGTVYDIVNRKGELSDRIQLPTGYQLVSFGPGRIVYLAIRDASGLHLARVRLR